MPRLVHLKIGDNEVRTIFNAPEGISTALATSKACRDGVGGR